MTTTTEELVTAIVEHTALYESTVGVRDRCVVFLQVKGESRMLTFDADIRDHLPVGRRVQLRYRPSSDDNSLVTLFDRKIL